MTATSTCAAKRRPAGHGEHDPLHRAPPQAPGQRGKRAPLTDRGTAVPRLYAEERTGVPAMHRRQGRRPVQTPGARADTATSGRQPGADDRRPEPTTAGMGRLLRLQPVARVAIARRLDHDDACVASSGSSGRRAASAIGTSSPEGPRTGGQRGHLQPKGTVADELLRSAAPRLHQQPLQSSGSASPWTSSWMLNPPNRRGTDPYARWCGRGGAARRPPIPIEFKFPSRIIACKQPMTDRRRARRAPLDAGASNENGKICMCPVYP